MVNGKSPAGLVGPASGMAALLNDPPLFATVTKFSKLQARLLQVNAVVFVQSIYTLPNRKCDG
jgi:hypothetical protein